MSCPGPWSGFETRLLERTNPEATTPPCLARFDCYISAQFVIGQFCMLYSTVPEAVFDIRMFRDLAPGFLNAN